MRVSIVGSGYVGITTGVALAYIGHQVTCLDSDEHKIDLLRRGNFPIYEPHLETLAALAHSRLRFTADPKEAGPGTEVIFIAVGTPSQADGNPDLSFLRAAAMSVGEPHRRAVHRRREQIHGADRLRQLGGVAGARGVRSA